MKIKKIVLIGYLRFGLRNIDYFEYTPKEKTQVILGSNGSGKSSLMKELSPLPAVPSEYRKGGRKEIWIEYRGKEYYLLSDFTQDGNAFEFVCDGVNLNPGRTVTVFKELVKSHFNYTQELHVLLTGQILFHELATNERRKLFMSMNKTDFTYAFSYFNKLKEKARDLQGTITQLQKRLSAEIEGLLTPEQEELVKRDAEGLRTILDGLLMSKSVQSYNPSHKEHERNALMDQFSMIRLELNEALGSYARIASRLPLETLEEKQRALQTSLTELRNEVNIRYEQHLKLEAELQDAKVLDGVDIEVLRKEVSQLSEKRAGRVNSLLETMPWEIAFENGVTPERLLDAALNMQDRLLHLVDELAIYKDREDIQSVTIGTYNAAVSAASTTEDQFKKAAQRVSILTEQKESLLRNKSEHLTVCPKCTHSWFLGFSEDKLKQIEGELTAVTTAMHVHEESLKKTNAVLEEYRDHLHKRNLLANLADTVPALQPVWDYFQKNNLFTNASTRIVTEFTRVIMYMKTLVDIKKLDRSLEEKQKLMAIYEASVGRNKAKLQETFNEIEARIEKVQSTIRANTESLSKINDEITTFKQIQHLKCQLTTTHHEIKLSEKEVLHSYMDAVIGDLINTLKTDIVQKERAVTQASMKKAVIENTQTSIASYKEELELLQIAIDALSPKTGLIAQGMSHFINAFIDSVNRWIAKVWSYPLALTLIEPEPGEDFDLDYKFAVMSNNKKDAPDIAKTSSGMREIIHLACVITCAKFMGFDYHPVFLDEFAVKMDDAHRKSAYSIIEHLINEADVSQVFLISHYENGYSSLSASDITVLCDANVVLPSHLSYNTCCQIN